LVSRDKKSDIMEFRKLQVTGKSSYIVSLPKNWIKKNEIKKGDELAILEDADGLLRISSVRKAETKQKLIPEIAIDNLSKAELQAIIIGNYVAGLEGFKMIAREGSLSTPKRKVITNIINTLAGFEIISESPELIEVKNLLEPSNFQIGEVVKRLALLSSLMMNDLVYSVKENKLELLEDIIAQDNEIDRLYLLVRRLLMIGSRDVVVAKKIGIDGSDSCIAWSFILDNIEKVADHIVEIAESIPPVLKGEIPEEIFEPFKESLELIRGLLEKILNALIEARIGLEDMNVNNTLEEINSFLKKMSQVLFLILEQKFEGELGLSLENIYFHLNEITKRCIGFVRVIIHYRQWIQMKM